MRYTGAMKTMAKFLMIAVGLALIGVTLAAIVVFARADKWSKPAIEKTMTHVYGVPTEIDRVSISPFAETVALHGVRIGNPEDFEASNAIECGRVTIQVDSRSMFSDSPTINLIRMEEVTLNFRHELGAGANLMRLLAHARETRDDEAGDGKRKVAIETIEFTGGTLQASSGVLPGGAALDIAPFTIEDVGGDKGLVPAAAGAAVLSGVLRETMAGGAAFRPIADALRGAFTDDEGG